MRPDRSLTVGVSCSPAADVCLFSREVYNVGLSFSHYSPNMGRLVRHAVWRADRAVAMVSHAGKPSACRCRSRLRDREYVYDRHPGILPRLARVYCAGTLGGGGRNPARPVADRLALHLRLFRRWPAHILAYKSRRTRGPARRPAVVAGLGPEG